MATRRSIGWTLIRTDEDDPEGDEIETQVCVQYARSSGCPARLHRADGDPGWPAEDAEVEIISVEVDILSGAPVELSELEESKIRDWIIENHDRGQGRWGD